jgi:hypothetical protein
MIQVHVSQINLVDLIRGMARRFQIFRQAPSCRPYKGSSARVDQDELRAGVDQEIICRGHDRGTSTIGILGGRQFWPISIHTEVSSSFSWFAAIQGIERIEDLVSLAPKGCFIAAEAIKRKAQKSTSNF